MKVVTDEIYGDHLRGIGHPESPDRVEVVAALLRERGLLGETVRARDATDEEIERVHFARYLELVKRETHGLHDARYLSTGDVVVDGYSLAVARRAAGGAIAAMEASVSANAPVFALVRPPGHHAESQRGMGFCLFNNAAIAARSFQAQHGGRVLIVDFDYHHGNGTQDIAGEGISYLSTHASPAYPGTGFETASIGRDLIVNVPLPASGIATEAFAAIWERLLERAGEFVKPDAIVVSAGFDYVKGDPVGDLGVDVEVAAALASAIGSVAQRYCNNRVAYVLEGGYDVHSLAESIERVLVTGAKNERDPLGKAAGASIPAEARSYLSRFDELLD